jgi:tRNA-2-methylthio-N6-dimethylallyladenosine synthase
MQIKKYHIITFGCQANLADSERIASRLENFGYAKAKKERGADLIVLNACSVRQSAINRVYGRIKELSAQGRSALGRRIILAGCILEKDKKKLLTKYQNIEFWHPDEYFDLIPINSNLKTVNIPIMTGCNNFCTYCAVPYTRGRERSRKAKNIIKEVKTALKKGVKEIWLLGQNVNSYKDKNINFAKLLKMINAIPGDFWIRFTSPHPKDFSDDLIKAMAESEKFPHYLNLPLQSGDDEILKKMNRPYTVRYYKKLVKKIRKAMPDIAISTDIIVGFPGETKKQFENTARAMREIKFDMAYLSEYSPRPGTLAAQKYKDDIPHKEKDLRKKKLNDILIKTALENNKKLAGKTLKILNNRTGGNKLVKISVISSQYSENKFNRVKITKATPWHLEGKLL